MNLVHTGALMAALTMILTGCKTDEKGTDAPDTDDTPDGCESELDQPDYIFPANAADNVFFRQGTVEVFFEQDETEEGTIAVVDAAGASVAGTTTFSANGETMIFTFDAALSPATTYTANVTYSCDKEFSSSFTTTSTGAPVATADFVGKVYNISLTSLGEARVTYPPGLGDTLLGLLAGAGDIDILVSPVEINGSGDIVIRGGLGTRDSGALAQDVCTESINFPEAADYDSNPFFIISGEDVSISVSDVNVVIAELEISGAFSTDASAIEGVRVNAFIDTEALELGDIGADLGDDLCATVSLLAGVECEDCGNGLLTCLRLTIENITADATAVPSVELITAQAVLDNGTCAE